MYKDLTGSKKQEVQKKPNNFETLLVKNPLQNYKKMSIFGSKIKINEKACLRLLHSTSLSERYCIYCRLLKQHRYWQ